MYRKLFLIACLALAIAGCSRRGMGPGEGGGIVGPEDPIDVSVPVVSVPAPDPVNPPGVVPKYEPEEMEGLKLYIFDENGLLVKVQKVTREQLETGQIETKLPPGEYTFVVWGGSSPDLSDFHDAQLKSGTTQEYIDIKEGVTTEEDFRMMLEAQKNSDGTTTPTVTDFEDVYYAISEHVVVSKDGKTSNVEFDFRRNSHVLRVTLINTDNAVVTRASAFDVYVEGKNGVYMFDDTIDPNAPTLHYIPMYEGAPSETTYESDFKVLRLDMTRRFVDPILLHVRFKGSDVDLIEPMNVVDYILSLKDINGKLLYPDQTALDNAYEFDIEIRFEEEDPGDDDVYLSVIVIINGYQVIEVEVSDIQPLSVQ